MISPHFSPGNLRQLLVALVDNVSIILRLIEICRQNAYAACPYHSPLFETFCGLDFVPEELCKLQIKKMLKLVCLSVFFSLGQNSRHKEDLRFCKIPVIFEVKI